MSEPSPKSKTIDKTATNERSLFKKIVEFLNPGPDSKDELIESLAEAEDNDVIGAQSRAMLEGVIRMADMTAGDVMVAVSRIDLLNIDADADELHRADEHHRQDNHGPAGRKHEFRDAQSVQQIPCLLYTSPSPPDS